MSTSRKTEASIRQGGPGASQENAKAPLEIEKPPADDDRRPRSRVSGGGGEYPCPRDEGRRIPPGLTPA